MTAWSEEQDLREIIRDEIKANEEWIANAVMRRFLQYQRVGPKFKIGSDLDE